MPAAANECKWRPTKNRYVFFLYCTFYFLFFYYYKAHEGPQQPTTANTGQRRSMQAHSGQRRPVQGPRQPTQANEGHSAAIDDRYVCFFIYILFFIFLLLQSPRRPTAANEGQCRPTKTKKGPTSASICPPPPPTSHDDSLVVSSASTCPPPPPTSHNDSLVVTPLLLLEYFIPATRAKDRDTNEPQNA